MQSLPRISVVTPSFNQAQYLPQTIHSVLDQQYPNLEYIIMDGGSTDGSVDIIKHNANRLTSWESKRDKGQADAIYRGFEKSTGDILCWINSDDYFLKGALTHVAETFRRFPEAQWLIGGCVIVRASGKPITKVYGYTPTFDSLLHAGMLFCQMSCFWRREVFFKVGGFDTKLQFCFDYDLFLRLSQIGVPATNHRILSAYRVQDASKTATLLNTVGIKEKELLQLKFGKGSYSAEQSRQIVETTQREIRRVQRLYYWFDAIRDPFFFAKSLGASIRDLFVK
jgi:Glycosyltransferases involved in cell wall biogenesis